MILRAGSFLWEQLNGPQAVALIQGLFSFFQYHLQPKLDYFDNLDIARATSQHLDLFGVVLGVPRPLVWNTDDPDWLRWFRLTDDEVMSDQGFSAPEDPLYTGVGGLLSYEYEEFSDPERIPIDAIKYRALLQAAASGEGMIGSLILLDKFVSVLFAADQYTITQPDNLSPGDTLITLFLADTVKYSALLSLVKLWLPNTHVIISVEV